MESVNALVTQIEAKKPVLISLTDFQAIKNEINKKENDY